MSRQEQSPNAGPAKEQDGPGKLGLTSDNQPVPSDGPGDHSATRTR